MRGLHWILSRGALAVGLAAVLLAPTAHAGLFDDDEARKAILDLRQRIDQGNQQASARSAELAEQISQLKRGLLDLNTQIELMRSEMARMRGQDEQIARDVAELQRRQKDVVQGVEDRIRKLEPVKVSLDGKEFLADPEEKRIYEDAFALVRKGDFVNAGTALAAFQRRYPVSGYSESVYFWLGNAQYARREYKEAINSFRQLLTMQPEHPKAAEAMLSIANCQIELKDAKAARKTIGELVQAHPKSEAAQAGRERLASLK
jgi:tol-pal system protein YbgF